jgi:hypothetical protein
MSKSVWLSAEEEKRGSDDASETTQGLLSHVKSLVLIYY